MNIVYGFGGLRADGDMLTLAPSIPKQWEGYRFHIVYLDEIICVEVRKGQTEIYTLHGGQIVLGIYGQITMIDGKSRYLSCRDKGGHYAGVDNQGRRI